MTAWQDDSARDLMGLGGRLALLTRGEGSHVWDDEGTRYLDFLGGIAVNSLGHAHPVFVEAVSAQAGVLAHVSNYFATPQQLTFAATLKRLAGTGDAGRVFFANSGTEANETAVKLARLHGGKTGKKRILSLDHAFHGRSIGALSLTPKPMYQDPFRPLLPDVDHIAPTLEALEAVDWSDVAALFVEPIQGEAGVVEHPEGFLRRARELTAMNGALLIVDEVQTGFGRTGEWFAFQREDILPDAMTLAKSIGAGFPLAALVTFGAASELFYPGTHNSTFGGNPLATAVGQAVADEIERADLLGNVNTRGAQIREAVSALPLVAGTRGKGLLIGIVLSAPVAAQVREVAHRRGLIVNAPTDEVIRIAPAYTIGDAEVEEFITLFGATLDEVAATTSEETPQ